jgi:hypothetical protein
MPHVPPEIIAKGNFLSPATAPLSDYRSPTIPGNLHELRYSLSRVRLDENGLTTDGYSAAFAE